MYLVLISVHFLGVLNCAPVIVHLTEETLGRLAVSLDFQHNKNIEAFSLE